jgi:hypothetical protein
VAKTKDCCLFVGSGGDQHISFLCKQLASDLSPNGTIWRHFVLGKIHLYYLPARVFLVPTNGIWAFG